MDNNNKKKMVLITFASSIHLAAKLEKIQIVILSNVTINYCTEELILFKSWGGGGGGYSVICINTSFENL